MFENLGFADMELILILLIVASGLLVSVIDKQAIRLLSSIHWTIRCIFYSITAYGVLWTFIQKSSLETTVFFISFIVPIIIFEVLRQEAFYKLSNDQYNDTQRSEEMRKVRKIIFTIYGALGIISVLSLFYFFVTIPGMEGFQLMILGLVIYVPLILFSVFWILYRSRELSYDLKS